MKGATQGEQTQTVNLVINHLLSKGIKNTFRNRVDTGDTGMETLIEYLAENGRLYVDIYDDGETLLLVSYGDPIKREGWDFSLGDNSYEKIKQVLDEYTAKLNFKLAVA